MIEKPFKRRVSRLLWLGVLFCTLSVGASDSFSQQNTLSPGTLREAPTITLSETKFDFGEVDEGSEVSHDFTVKNRGKAELQITKVSRS